MSTSFQSEANILLDSEDRVLEDIHDDRKMMCNFVYENAMFLIGGATKSNRFLRLDLENDKVVILPDLPFEHSNGLCQGFERYGIACGGDDSRRNTCFKLDHNFDWSHLPEMRNSHYTGALANVNQEPVAISESALYRWGFIKTEGQNFRNVETEPEN